MSTTGVDYLGGGRNSGRRDGIKVAMETFALISGILGILFACAITLVIVLVVRTAARERERRARLHAHAAQRFVIKPTDRPEAIQVVTPVIRQAMFAGHFLNWQVSDGTLILAYWDTPRIENLQPRADGIVHLAHLLSNR
jgi:hypothetical protein